MSARNALLKAQHELDTLQELMDYELSEQATEAELRPLYDEWLSLSDYINNIHSAIAEGRA